MKRENVSLLLMSSILIFSILLTACGGAVAVPSATSNKVPPTVPPAAPTEVPSTASVVNTTSELNIAVVRYGSLDEPWESTLQDALTRAQNDKPHGVTINFVNTESVHGEDAIRVMREYASSGKYQIIWSTEGAGSDYIKTMMADFPDILFAHSGSGGTGLGKNSCWVFNYVYEAAYLLGEIAGSMTKTNVIGFIGSFPGAESNTEGNAYILGAKDANPNVKVKVTFINSWYDPVLAKEAAVAQIAAGADIIFPKVYGAFEALSENHLKGFGGYVDQTAMAPDVVVASTLLLWDANVKYLIDTWWNHTQTGQAYNCPTEPFYGLMKDNGAGISLNEKLLPADLAKKINDLKTKIISGELVIPMIMTEPTSD